VLDRDAATGCDQRLLAHLAADEPVGNALLVCHDYLRRERSERTCRLLTADDPSRAPVSDGRVDRPEARWSITASEVELRGSRYRIERRAGRMVIPELRWTRARGGLRGESVTTSLRGVIGEVESYEPFRRLSRWAIALHAEDPDVSCTTMQAELARVLDSSIVLNRGVREAVLRAVRDERSSMSEIAMRCGRVKRDCRGNQSGETSWLARRVGLLAEGGQGSPTPWVHSDVLGLIAWRGLGISPREVELG
jgi:hypothetical protein